MNKERLLNNIEIMIGHMQNGQAMQTLSIKKLAFISRMSVFAVCCWSSHRYLFSETIQTHPFCLLSLSISQLSHG